MVERLFHCEKDELLYIGDHIYTDVNMVKATMRWRTALVVQELEAEVAALADGARVLPCAARALPSDARALPCAAVGSVLQPCLGPPVAPPGRARQGATVPAWRAAGMGAAPGPRVCASRAPSDLATRRTTRPRCATRCARATHARARTCRARGA